MKIDPQFCRVDDGLDTILGKWKIPIILYLLKNQTMRFSDLQKVLPEISKKMLSKNLKELEEDDLITRTVYPTVPPKVEYNLTEHGKELEDIIDSLHKWGLRHQTTLIKKSLKLIFQSLKLSFFSHYILVDELYAISKQFR